MILLCLHGNVLIRSIVGHSSRECDKKRDYSRITCQNCGEKGHTKVRCKQPPKVEDNSGDDGNSDPFNDTTDNAHDLGGATVTKIESSSNTVDDGW